MDRMIFEPMNLLTPDTIDFSAYMRETEPATKVKPASVFIADMIANLGKRGIDPKAFLPWHKTHKTFAFRPGEVTLWAGVNGHGKSLITGMVALSLVAQGERTCIASFEMKPRKSLERMARQWTSQDTDEEFLVGNDRAVSEMTDLYEQFSTFTEKHLWFYDQQGTVNTQLLIGVIRYCAKELKVKHFFIDSLMKCVSGDDDWNGQKAFVDELTAIARDNDMHIHLVHHIRKLANEATKPDKNDVKGSGSIADQVDNLMLIWRNKTKEKARASRSPFVEADPDAAIICEKQRNGEWEGVIGLWFHRESQQFVSEPGANQLEFFSFPHRTAA